MLRSTLTRTLRCIRDVVAGKASMQASDVITNNLEVYASPAGVVGYIVTDPPPTPPRKPIAVGPLRVYPEDDQPQHAKV